jgi:hypothetical protein
MSGSLSPAIGQSLVPKNVRPPRASISRGDAAQGCQTNPLIAGPSGVAGTSNARSPAAWAVEKAHANAAAIRSEAQRMIDCLSVSDAAFHSTIISRVQ